MAARSPRFTVRLQMDIVITATSRTMEVRPQHVIQQYSCTAPIRRPSQIRRTQERLERAGVATVDRPTSDPWAGCRRLWRAVHLAPYAEPMGYSS